MNAAIVDAGTKYFARSLSLVSAAELFERIWSFQLIMPRRHLRPASNTPDPEFPVVTSAAADKGRQQ